MFIELTDHLRCTESHAEQFLVLLPDTLEGRRVVSGDLGCPVCGKTVRLEQGCADFGGGSTSTGATTLSAEAIAAFLGISGPGGYIALIGAAAGTAQPLQALLPGVRFALVNPAAGQPDTAEASVLRAGRLPLKQGSMRGVVVGEEYAALPEWVRDAAAATLAGLRIVVAGPVPENLSGVEVLAHSEGCWVGQKR